MTPPPIPGVFVTGTDTEVGKTGVAAALTLAWTQRGRRSAALKPVSAGRTLIDGQWVNEDVHVLHGVASVPLSADEVGLVQLRNACAPHIAARLEGVALDRHALLATLRGTMRRLDAVVVEGVGGFCVPLTEDWDTADLAVDLGLPVVLVVGLRLGCLNHALLTAQAVHARGLRLAGWVGNTLDPDMPHVKDNLLALSRLDAPCLGVVPRLSPLTPHAVLAHLDPLALDALDALTGAG